MTQPSSGRKKRTVRADLASVPDLPVGTPMASRELGPKARDLWTRLWSMNNPWISPQVDLDHVTLLCEAVDERVALRRKVLTDGDWRDRVADGLAYSAGTAALTQLLDLLATGSTATSGTANLTPFEIPFSGWGVPI